MDAALDSARNKTVLITGAGRGIGKRLALGFAAAGAGVGLLARSPAELNLTQLEIEHAGGRALQLPADVRDYAQVAAAVACLRSELGPVDVLVCAAGVQGPIGRFWEVSMQSAGDVVQVNLVGAMHACRAVLPDMIRRRSGKILLLACGGAAYPRPNFAAYAASKAALARFAETLAGELRDHNVQVNCVSPGAAYTHMTDEILQAGERAGARELDQARLVRQTGGMTPDLQIAVALFLASDRANHISGKLIHADDDWQRLEHTDIHREIFTLRRIQKI